MSKVVLALRTFATVALPYFRSEDKWRARALLIGVIGAELGVVYLAVMVNHWHARFFNAVEARSWDALGAELVVFVFLTGGAIVTAMVQFYFGQMLVVRWREWLTVRYVGLWMAQGRQYRVRFTHPEVDNIHLRIGGDVLQFIQRTLELGTGILSSLVSLFSFAYILWGISATAPLPLFGFDFSFPGYLIWAALAYATIGIVIAHYIGWPLIPLNFNQQRREADFRFAMARVSDHTEPVALIGGETVERAELRRRFGALVDNWVAMILRNNRLNAFIFGYYHVSTVLPTLIVTPAYLVGAISLGVLMQAALAFQKVESAFAFCTSYAKIAEWKALLDRMSQFEDAMRDLDAPVPRAIDIAHVPGGELAVAGLVLRLADGEAIATVPDITLAPAQRLLVSGPSGAGKSSLFRAIAGVWTLGDGSIRLPENARVLALPQRPYFPLGTLRQALAYPLPAETVDDADMRAAMAAAGLGHLVDRLDEEAEWSTVLSGGEQQRAGFARAFIFRPTLLLLDEATLMLEDSEARDLYSLLSEKLPDAMVVTIARPGPLPHHRGIEMNAAPAARSVPGDVPLVAVPA